MKIKINELRDGFDRIFSHLLTNGVEEVEVPFDFYWNIDESEKYDVDANPERLDMGQLSDDYAELMQINSGESDPIPYALVWLSSLARAVGENKIV